MTMQRDLDRELRHYLEERNTGREPEGLLTATMARVGRTGQRPGWLVLDRLSSAPRLAGGRTRSRLGRSVPLGLVGVVAIVVVAVLLLSPGGPLGRWMGVVGESPSPTHALEASPAPTATPRPTGSPRPTPTLPPGGLRIDFRVSGGLYAFLRWTPLPATNIEPVPTPPPHMVGNGTFTMSGAFTDAGTFTDDITYKPDGTFRVARTLHTARGGLDAVATVMTFQTDYTIATLHGSWRFTGGTGAWSTVAAQGTLNGATLTASESWIGTVGP